MVPARITDTKKWGKENEGCKPSALAALRFRSSRIRGGLYWQCSTLCLATVCTRNSKMCSPLGMETSGSQLTSMRRTLSQQGPCDGHRYTNSQILSLEPISSFFNFHAALSMGPDINASGGQRIYPSAVCLDIQTIRETKSVTHQQHPDILA